MLNIYPKRTHFIIFNKFYSSTSVNTLNKYYYISFKPRNLRFSTNKQFLSLIESQLFFNFNTFIHFFSNYFTKNNFYLYTIYNDINIKFFVDFLYFIERGVKTRFLSFKYNFSLYFFFNLFAFFYYKNANIMLNFLTFFIKNYNYKIQRILNKVLTSVFSFINVNIIKEYGLAGCQIKIKGKYTQRPGDRRKTYFYRLGAFSYSNPINKYYIQHVQLNYKSGASGCTIITLLL